jgi:hypothetical protein
MSIVFTQYLRPHGRKERTEIDMPPAIEALAKEFVEAGGWYESEMLGDDKTVSLTACWNREDGDNDIAIEVVPNGPAVVDAVEAVVRKSIVFLQRTRDRYP